ncbi:MAG TPA: hypothetical protein GXZ48_07600 [Acholeplasmataceae bacterium]|nr:hypothetical protein [Acholeplasmataceae bacterium]
MKNVKIFILAIIIYLVFGLTAIVSKIKVFSNNFFDTSVSYNPTNSKDDLLDVSDPLESISEGVTVNGYIYIDDGLLVYGHNKNYPYLEYVKDDKSIKSNFKDYQGEIIDVIDNSYYLTTLIKINDLEVEKSFFIAFDKIIPFYKKQLTFNFSTGVTIKPKYLVIHETANTHVGANANAHYRYWSFNPTAKASTHFVVDSKEIYQMLELNQMAWHVGDNRGYSDIINSNSIGIEIAVNSDGNFEVARKYAIALTIYLMNELNMDISQLKNHNDASGKYCPTNMLNERSLWYDFKAEVEAGLKK